MSSDDRYAGSFVKEHDATWPVTKLRQISQAYNQPLDKLDPTLWHREEFIVPMLKEHSRALKMLPTEVHHEYIEHITTYHFSLHGDGCILFAMGKLGQCVDVWLD